jgi:hypothetical protein
VSVRRTVQLCHGLLATTPATVAGAERQRHFRVVTTKITARPRKHKCSADIQQLQNCQHIITVLLSNGRCDVLYRELYFRREDRFAVVNT